MVATDAPCESDQASRSEGCSEDCKLLQLLEVGFKTEAQKQAIVLYTTSSLGSAQTTRSLFESLYLHAISPSEIVSAAACDALGVLGTDVSSADQTKGQSVRVCETLVKAMAIRPCNADIARSCVRALRAWALRGRAEQRGTAQAGAIEALMHVMARDLESDDLQRCCCAMDAIVSDDQALQAQAGAVGVIPFLLGLLPRYPGDSHVLRDVANLLTGLMDDCAENRARAANADLLKTMLAQAREAEGCCAGSAAANCCSALARFVHDSALNVREAVAGGAIEASLEVIDQHQADLAVARAVFNFYWELLDVAPTHRTRLKAAGVLESALRAMDQSAAALVAVHDAGSLCNDTHVTAFNTLRCCFALLVYMVEDCPDGYHERALNAGALEAAITTIAHLNAKREAVDVDIFCWAIRLVACFLREDGPGASVRLRAVEAGVIEMVVGALRRHPEHECLHSWAWDSFHSIVEPGSDPLLLERVRASGTLACAATFLSRCSDDDTMNIVVEKIQTILEILGLSEPVSAAGSMAAGGTISVARGNKPARLASDAAPKRRGKARSGAQQNASAGLSPAEVAAAEAAAEAAAAALLREEEESKAAAAAAAKRKEAARQRRQRKNAAEKQSAEEVRASNLFSADASGGSSGSCSAVLERVRSTAAAAALPSSTQQASSAQTSAQASAQASAQTSSASATSAPAAPPSPSIPLLGAVAVARVGGAATSAQRPQPAFTAGGVVPLPRHAEQATLQVSPPPLPPPPLPPPSLRVAQGAAEVPLPAWMLSATAAHRAEAAAAPPALPAFLRGSPAPTPSGRSSEAGTGADGAPAATEQLVNAFALFRPV